MVHNFEKLVIESADTSLSNAYTAIIVDMIWVCIATTTPWNSKKNPNTMATSPMLCSNLCTCAVFA